MPRLFKILILVFFAYAIFTATPEQQTRIFEGVLATRDAAFAACQRKGALCTEAISSLYGVVDRSLADGPAPWLDDPAKRK
ncbi:MAG: hypothetical protein NW216_06755 [Hyphomicrobium sp.]|nr:hypothetical protein [Hyphomicrobium sp.]